MARILLPLLFLAVTAFIFSNSLQPGDVSGAASQQVTAWVTGTPDISGGTALEGFIRKLGHVGEFALLGLAMALCLRAFTRRWWPQLLLPFGCGIVVAAIDEIIQLYVPGRSSRVSDVFIDLLGVALGLALGRLFIWLAGRGKAHKTQ